MIYILFVVYNSEFHRVFDCQDEETRVIIFDNSTTTLFQNRNSRFAQLHGYIYESFGSNLGLSAAYNFVIKKYIQITDWLVILDSDTMIDEQYFKIVKRAIASGKNLVYSPINIDKSTNLIDSPKEVCDKFLFSSKGKAQFDAAFYAMTINNGLVISGKVFEIVGMYNNDIFLYFVDSYFCAALYFSKIKVGILNYSNYCDFSFRKLPHASLIKKLKLMKKDAIVYYKWLYKMCGHPSRWLLHYFLFSVKKAIECAKGTSFIYFLAYVFARRDK